MSDTVKNRHKFEILASWTRFMDYFNL